jgi:hypothetical protein
MSHDFRAVTEQIDVPNFTRETCASEASLRRRIAVRERSLSMSLPF